MTLSNKQKIVAVLKALENGDDSAQQFFHPRFIDHDPILADGNEPQRTFGGRSAPSRVIPARVFEDKDYVFAHSQYDSLTSTVGFDVFRFDGGLIIEHWENAQQAVSANPSGRTMIDGPTSSIDHALTDTNREIIRQFTEEMVSGNVQAFARFFNGDRYLQHNAWFPDTLSGTLGAVAEWMHQGIRLQYVKVHRILAEGDFVLAMCECRFKEQPAAVYDLWRIEHGKLAEHWDTIATIPPQSLNQNGKF
jgi:predicted SnoaL-like aldol condensation-catalyzing enzyme